MLRCQEWEKGDGGMGGRERMSERNTERERVEKGVERGKGKE